jgi:putative endonuclease
MSASPKQYYIYILASKKNGTLYIGLTSDIVKRVWEHKQDLVTGFSKSYGVHTLVYFEACNDIKAALAREKQLKTWKRNWKIQLIEGKNQEWVDLYPTLLP